MCILCVVGNYVVVMMCVDVILGILKSYVIKMYYRDVVDFFDLFDLL